MAQLAEGLPSLYETQSSIPSIAQTACNPSVIPKHGSGVQVQHGMCERKGVRKERGGEGRKKASRLKRGMGNLGRPLVWTILTESWHQFDINPFPA